MRELLNPVSQMGRVFVYKDRGQDARRNVRRIIHVLMENGDPLHIMGSGFDLMTPFFSNYRNLPAAQDPATAGDLWAGITIP